MNIEEREEFVQEVIERVFKVLPEVIGNLMASHAINSNMVKQFYKDNPEFKDHGDIVRECIAKVESSNPTLSYDKILSDAIPGIRESIKLKSTTTNNIPRSIPNLTDNGSL